MIKYKTKEVLEKVGISQASLYRYIGKGLIEKPIKTFNGRIYFTDKHINDLNTLLNGEKVIEEDLPKATKSLDERGEGKKSTVKKLMSRPKITREDLYGK